MGDVEALLVTSEKIRERAQVFQQLLSRAEKSCEKIRKISAESGSCFCGTTAEAFKTELENKLTVLEEEIQGWRNHCEKLHDVATEYEAAEGENKNVITGNRSAFWENASSQPNPNHAGRKYK